MKQLFILILWLGCFAHAIQPVSAQKREVRTLPAFNSVNIQGGFWVELISGESEKIEISSTKIDSEKIVTKINKQGELIVRVKGKFNLYQSIKYMDDNNESWGVEGRIKLRITYQQLNSLTRSGSGWAKVSQPLIGERLSLRNSGSGDIFVEEFRGNYLEASGSGSGKIIVAKGSAERQELSISGSGKIDNIGLSSEHTECSVSGSGQVFVQVSRRLEASVSGTGQVRYVGKPTNLESSVSGSGTIQQQ